MRPAAGAPGRVDRVGTVNLGNIDALDRLGGPFDDIVRIGRHPAVRCGSRPAQPQEVRFFLWRLRSYPLVGVTAAARGRPPGRLPLQPARQRGAAFSPDTVVGIRTPARARCDLPGPIRRLALLGDLDAAADAARDRWPKRPQAGPLPRNRTRPPWRLVEGAATTAPTSNAVLSLPSAIRPAISLRKRSPLRGSRSATSRPGDAPRPGRTPQSIRPVAASRSLRPPSPGPARSFGSGSATALAARPARTSAADPTTGSRQPWTRRPGTADTAFRRRVARVDPGDGPWSSSVAGAIGVWLAETPPLDRAVIEIIDSSTYREGDLVIDLPRDATLEIRSADRERPVSR